MFLICDSVSLPLNLKLCLLYCVPLYFLQQEIIRQGKSYHMKGN